MAEEYAYEYMYTSMGMIWTTALTLGALPHRLQTRTGEGGHCGEASKGTRQIACAC